MSRVVLTGWVAVIFAIFAVGCSRRPVAEAEVAGTSSAAAVWMVRVLVCVLILFGLFLVC